ncbi:MAG: hypothetical protein H6707_02250 [Deltaproteobacteria bacterium]|nr:hypothetical protein [Deltaproteobacteria bacterium]
MTIAADNPRSLRFARRVGVLLINALLINALLLCACNSADQPPTSALFDLDGQLFDVPYPNDLRRRADGTIDLRDLPEQLIGVLGIYGAIVESGESGFSSNGASHLRFSRPIDPRTLPRVADSTSFSSAVRLVNIEPTSSAYGEAIPIESRFVANAGKYIANNSLAVLPALGFPARPGERHALIISDALLDAQGEPVVAAPALEQLLSAQWKPQFSISKQAHTTYQPLRDYLRDSGTTGVVSASVFTTGRHTEPLEQIYALVKALPPPTMQPLELTSQTPTYYLLEGAFDVPTFQTGTRPYQLVEDGGSLARDAQGQIKIAGSERIRFAISLPRGPMPAGGWPIVLYAHGTGGDYRTFVSNGIAQRLSSVNRSGALVAAMAVIGIDQPLHGPRAPASSEPSLTFFNVLNPRAAVANVLQGAADNFSLLALVRQLSFSKLIDANSQQSQPLGYTARFDLSRIAFFGHSQGALTGSLFVGTEPTVDIAVLSGAGGHGALSLLQKTEPVDVTALVRAAVAEPVDLFHPVATLMQQLLEVADPINYAHRFIKHPKGQPRHVLITEGLIDHYTPTRTTEALATAAGLPQVGPVLQEVPELALRQLGAQSLPLAGNLEVDYTRVSAGLMQFRAPQTGRSCNAEGIGCASGHFCDNGVCRSDGHFVAFRVPRAITQIDNFLATFFRDGVPLFVSP